MTTKIQKAVTGGIFGIAVFIFAQIMIAIKAVFYGFHFLLINIDDYFQLQGHYTQRFAKMGRLEFPGRQLIRPLPISK